MSRTSAVTTRPTYGARTGIHATSGRLHALNTWRITPGHSGTRRCSFLRQRLFSPPRDTDKKGRYWEVNYIDVYERGLNNTAPGPESATTTTVKTTSTVYTTVPNPATIVSSFMHNGTVVIQTTVQSIATAGPSSTAPPSPSTDPLVPDHGPASIGEYTYLGCYGSATGFQSFVPKTSAADMTLEKCVDLCKPGKYAGVRGRCVHSRPLG